MNAAPSSADSAPPYNFSDTWQFPINGGGNVALSDRGGSELRRPHFGPRVGLNHRGSRGSGGAPPQDEDSPNLHSSSGGSGMNGCSGRTNSVRLRDESRDYKTEMELSSGKGVGEIPQPSETPKQDYIHVRARRGQATDSHSLAERARRDKISERMKILQDLVPGCNKVVGKALVLDEIINYIQSLQCQVEFLSMKLETVNSRINSGIEEFPSNDFDQQTYDAAGVSFGPQASRQYGGGSSPEWLHMQVGSFPRTT